MDIFSKRSKGLVQMARNGMLKQHSAAPKHLPQVVDSFPSSSGASPPESPCPGTVPDEDLFQFDEILRHVGSSHITAEVTPEGTTGQNLIPARSNVIITEQVVTDNPKVRKSLFPAQQETTEATKIQPDNIGQQVATNKVRKNLFPVQQVNSYLTGHMTKWRKSTRARFFICKSDSLQLLIRRAFRIIAEFIPNVYQVTVLGIETFEATELLEDISAAGIDFSTDVAVLDLDNPCVQVLIQPSDTEHVENQHQLSPQNSPEDGTIQQDNLQQTVSEEESDQALVENDNGAEDILEGALPKPKRKRRAAPLSPNASPKRRKRNEIKWKCVQAKQARAKGIAHVSLRGKHVPEKVLLPGCSESCRLKCHLNVSHEERQTVFKNYYNTSDNFQKWNYISRCVSISPVKRRTTDEDFSRRHNTLQYKLQLSDKSKVRVCRKFFLDTIATSEQTVKTAMIYKQKNHFGVISPDKRGKKKPQGVVGTVIRNNVKAHISSFKPVESHYCRKTSKCLYLPHTLNVRKMHALYKMGRADNEPHTASLRQYRDVFRSDFYIKFVKPKKDMCSVCLNWSSKSAEEKGRNGEQEKFDLHIANKKKGFELKEADSIRPKTENNVCVISVDFQQILECPKGKNSEYYYRSKLKCYNFSIFEHYVKQGHCFVWDQTIAAKGAIEVSSCLYKFIEELSKKGVVELIVWSDNCWSQNKNQFVFSMFNMSSIRFNMKITHRFLEKGHTHMEVDSMHALIERSGKGIEIFTPSQHYAIMKTAKKTDPRYRVVEMQQADFKDFREVASHHNWSRVKTSKLREIVVYKNEVEVKYSYEEEASKYCILKKQAGRPVRWDTYPLKQAYLHKFVIPKHVLDDIKWFVHQGHITSSCVPFYENLFSEQAELTNVANDPVNDCGDDCESCDDSEEEAVMTENESGEE